MPDGLADEAVSDRFGRPTNARPAGANGTSWDAGFGLESFLEESEETASSRRPAAGISPTMRHEASRFRQQPHYSAQSHTPEVLRWPQRRDCVW